MFKYISCLAPELLKFVGLNLHFLYRFYHLKNISGLFCQIQCFVVLK